MMANKFISPAGGVSTKAPSSFANMNVREFFETQSVEVTKETNRKVKQEIERKREELRVLVGERYRDLIDAADTIGTMRAGSAQVFSKLSNLRSALISLPTALKSGPQIYSTGDDPAKKENARLSEKELELAAELKLSTTVPRQVLVCLESDDIVGALHLTLLYKESLDPALKSYQWSFQQSQSVATGDHSKSPSEDMVQALLHQCERGLDEFSTPSEHLAECIIVKQILMKSSCEQIIRDFLSRRVELCKNAVGASEGADFVSKVASAILNINQIFIDPELYNAAAKKVRKAKLDAKVLGFLSSYLPPCLSKILSETIPVQDPPRVSLLAETLLKYYIEPLKKVVAGSTNSFMNVPQTIKEMEEIRSIACSILKRDTEDIMRMVLGSSTNVWDEVFAPEFLVRCQHVVAAKIQALVTSLRESTITFHASGVNFDLVSFTWKAGSTNTADTYGDLDETIKVRCLSPSVAELCAILETYLQELLADFQSLVDNPLKEFISTEMTTRFESFIAETLSEEESWNLFLGRFTAAICELCPTLWKLLDKNDIIKIKQTLSSRSEKCWGDWTQILLKEFEMQLEERMPDLSSQVVSSFMPVGEIYRAEGEDFQPSTRVPLQLSHSLHTLLSSICLKLSKVGPQSVPKSVRDNLRLVIGETIISRYQNLVESLERTDAAESMSPQMAVQFVFDLKFIQWFHPKLGANVEPLSAKLQGVIDPFDWDICSPRLTVNLKRFLFENHLTLGLLFSEESHGFIAQNFKTKQNQSFPFSNVMLTIPLPLLPI